VNDLTSSVWRTAYVAPILETDALTMATRVSDARSAINERRNSVVKIAQAEHEALDAAVETCKSYNAASELINSVGSIGDTVPS
jgi:hypothetical protein